MTTFVLKNWYKFIGKSPADMPMVRYWQFRESVPAKVTYNSDGAVIMKMEGEDYAFPGFPRGYLLFGKLSKLKHEIKNQIFNDSWAKLEANVREEEIVEEIKKKVFDNIFALAEETKYDMVPYERMFKAVKEIYRAWTKVAPSERSLKLRDVLTFILQEDDSYRFRVQWIAQFLRWMNLLRLNPIKTFDRALSMLEHGEVIGDMKEKARLLKRILLVAIRDPQIGECFKKFCREVDWKKVMLSDGDKYHFRGKYFKVDLNLFEY